MNVVLVSVNLQDFNLRMLPRDGCHDDFDVASHTGFSKDLSSELSGEDKVVLCVVQSMSLSAIFHSSILRANALKR